MIPARAAISLTCRPLGVKSYRSGRVSTQFLLYQTRTMLRSASLMRQKSASQTSGVGVDGR